MHIFLSVANWQEIYCSSTQHCCRATGTGDADYNDVVDAARIAGHKVHLYHSHAVAHTLQGNVDHHEAWQTFLARKSGKNVADLEDSGYTLRLISPTASRSSGRLSCQVQLGYIT